jgi:hypothetical protein
VEYNDNWSPVRFVPVKNTRHFADVCPHAEILAESGDDLGNSRFEWIGLTERVSGMIRVNGLIYILSLQEEILSGTTFHLIY